VHQVHNLVFSIIKRKNVSIYPLSFTFVSDKSFKFFKYQICSLSFTFVSNKSFKFFKYQICSLSFMFVSDKSFKFVSNMSYFLRTLKDLFDTNLKLKGLI
jgi:uncharacterized protein (DUF1499 family)